MAPAKKKMTLGEFFADDKESGGSWADEMNEYTGFVKVPDTRLGGYGGDRRAFSSATGVGNGYNDRRDDFSPREQLPLPTKPPYTAHVGNLSFDIDITEGDVKDFFNECGVTNVRIVVDKLDKKPKGFCYAEFAKLEGLEKALGYTGLMLGGRPIRVSVADPPKERQDGRDFGDWSRKGPLPDISGPRRVSERTSYPGRVFDNVSDAGSERGGRRTFEQGDGKVRDFSNWERKGPLSPATSAAPSLSEGGRQHSKDGPAFRRGSPAWGEGTTRSQDGSRPPGKEHQEKPLVERAPTAPELDNQWRSKMRPDAPANSSREPSNPPSPGPASVPATRPKLNLQKRTVSEAEPGPPPPTSTTVSEPRASPFGAARPVDTSAKEKEIAEKRLREAKDKATSEKGNVVGTPNVVNEGEADTSQSGKNPDISPRTSEGANGMVAEEKGIESAASVTPADDKAVKPKEVIRDAPAKGQGSGGRGENARESGTSADDTNKAMEEEGWSTVSKTKQRNYKRPNQPGRAIAS